MSSILDQRRFLLVWNVINAALLVYVLSHESTAPVIFGRYTRFYALGAGVAVLLAAGVLALSLTTGLQAALRRRLSGRLSLLTIIAVIAVNLALWLLPSDADQIKLFIGANTFLLGLWLSAERERASFPVVTVLSVTTVALLTLGFFSAYRYPPPHPGGDEVTWMNYAVTWLRTGMAYPQIVMADPLPIVPGVGYWVIGLAAWLRLFGVTFVALRVLVWLVYAAVVLSIGLVGARLYDRATGWLAAIIAASSMLMLSRRLLRPELALIIPAVLILLAYTRRRHALWAFICGLLCVFTLEIHASGIAYILALSIAFLWDAARAWRHGEPLLRVSLIPFLAGGVLGGVVYLFAHILILPEPGYFFENLRSGRDFLMLINLAERWWRVLADYWVTAPLELIAFALALLILWRRNSGHDRTILSLFAVTLLAYLFFVPYQQVYYVIFLPYIVLAIAALVRAGLDTAADASHRLATGVMLAALAMPFVAVSARHLSLTDPYPSRTLSGAEQCLRHLADPGAVVAGDIAAYWTFLDYDHYVATIGEYELLNYRELTSPLEPWDRVQPDVVFFTQTPGYPQLSPRISAYVAHNHYQEIIRFVSDGHPVQVWLRPGYEPPGGREQALAFCKSAVETLPD